MTNDLRAAAERLLAELDDPRDDDERCVAAAEAAEALRAALAAEQPQPTAYMIENDGAVGFARTMSVIQRAAAANAGSRVTPLGPLYAASPAYYGAQRVEVHDPGAWHIEERTFAPQPAALAAEQPQPVATLIRGEGGAFSVRPDMDNLRAIYDLPTGEHPLYAAPPPPAAATTDAMVEAAVNAAHRADATLSITVGAMRAAIGAALAAREGK